MGPTPSPPPVLPTASASFPRIAFFCLVLLYRTADAQSATGNTTAVSLTRGPPAPPADASQKNRNTFSTPYLVITLIGALALVLFVVAAVVVTLRQRRRAAFKSRSYRSPNDIVSVSPEHHATPMNGRLEDIQSSHDEDGSGCTTITVPTKLSGSRKTPGGRADDSESWEETADGDGCNPRQDSSGKMHHQHHRRRSEIYMESADGSRDDVNIHSAQQTPADGDLVALTQPGDEAPLGMVVSKHGDEIVCEDVDSPTSKH